MNSIVKSAQGFHATRFQRQLLFAETEFYRVCSVFGHESAEAKAAWYERQGMKRAFRIHTSAQGPEVAQAQG